MKKIILLIFFIYSTTLLGQQTKNRVTKTFNIPKNNTVQIDTISIQPTNFKIYTLNKTEIDSANYKVDFAKAIVIFNSEITLQHQKVIIEYTLYPNFLTKTYQSFNSNLIVPNANTQTQLYSLTTNSNTILTKPFEELEAKGSITRGLTVGNNQNGVVNSMLDLNIEGKLSDNIVLRASILDTNVPIQENGNTYALNEFDRVFIELIGDKWTVNAGDIYLENRTTNYLNFNKKVSGLAVNTLFKNKNSEFSFATSGAIVRGKYNSIQFNGSEGNQGPYRIYNFNNSYVLILQGSEKIYANGILLQRGENNDYTIDYNTAEITFNTTFPITANTRISAEYQYTDRAYTRFTSYNHAYYKTKKLELNGYFFTENDLKNQPLEQDLTNEQKEILALAGNNQSEMVAPSAYLDTYSEDKILYKKVQVGNEEIFEYSTNPNEELYAVAFTYVGENKGSYLLQEIIATGKIYYFVGNNLGNYNPVNQLIAPNKLQIAVVKAQFNPSEKTTLKSETAFSINDQNLFSTIDNNQNKGIASKFDLEQIIFSNKWSLKSTLNYDYVSENFKTIERIQQVEFNRDWNIDTLYKAQKLVGANLILSQKNTELNYNFEALKLDTLFTGNRHQFFGKVNSKSLFINFKSSVLNSNSKSANTLFLRNNINVKYTFKNGWAGFKFNQESNKRKNNLNNTYLKNSHQFNEKEIYIGVGDSAKVFSQIGINFSATDSIQNTLFKKVNNAKTYYLNSKLINTNNANLDIYINYRTVKNTNFNNEESLNAKIFYKQQLFNQFLLLSTNYQTLSGTLPQQDYTYIKTEPGQGFYMWIDYNNNQIKELNEFEIAQFPDQAEYLRVVLPTVTYLPTHQNKFTQTILINPQQWRSKNGLKKVLSYFSNQTYLITDSKQNKIPNKFNLNPFDLNNENALALNYTFNNSFSFNKGKKYFTTTYNYIKSNIKNTTTIDNLENLLHSHQIQFEHQISKFWLLNISANSSANTTESQNFTNRNFKINSTTFNPKISYYYNTENFLSVFYELKNKENKIGDLEQLTLNNIGANANLKTNKNLLIQTEINFFNNNFRGNAISPTAYQMLEGLQPGKNYTWSVLLQHKLNSFLNLTANYLGRKSETSNTIHTGTIQLKAIF
jgi:hypothetical protein